MFRQLARRQGASLVAIDTLPTARVSRCIQLPRVFPRSILPSSCRATMAP